MHTTQEPNLFVIYREGFDLNTGNKNHIVVDEDLSFSQQPTSSTIVSDSEKRYYFPPVKDSNSFGTVDYMLISIEKLDSSIDYVIKFFSIQQQKTLNYICQLEWTQLLTILAISTQNPQFAGYI